jgi:two-component system, chemotaxis family, response regulator Rcp1
MTSQRFNILLIDDNPADARLFEAAMREVAPRVTLYWVATGQEGKEALERRDRFQDVLGFDIVVMDLNMAPIDGFELLKGIREVPGLASIPIIVMSSSRNPDDIERAYRCGANSYIVKSVTLEGAYDAAGCIARYWLEIVALPSRLS